MNLLAKLKPYAWVLGLVLSLWCAFTVINYFVVVVKVGDGDIHVARAPVAECPSGWKDTSNRDEHSPVFSCSRQGWLVILHPDGSFNYAWKDFSADFTYNQLEVSGWPAPSSLSP